MPVEMFWLGCLKCEGGELETKLELRLEGLLRRLTFLGWNAGLRRQIESIILVGCGRVLLKGWRG